MEIKPVKLITSCTTFQDVQKSLQEIERVLNTLQASTNPEPEIDMKDEKGKPGDLRTNANADKTYSLELNTKEGWKIATVQKQKVTFIDKGAAIVQTKKQSIDEIESDDTSKGTSTANKTIYDEKAGKFVLPRPDYDSGWVVDGADEDNPITLEHGLEITTFSLMDIQVSNASTGANATWVDAITEADQNKSGYIVQVKDNNNVYVGIQQSGAPDIDCAGITWEGLSTHFRLRLWK